jgi:hypothetical protein
LAFIITGLVTLALIAALILPLIKRRRQLPWGESLQVLTRRLPVPLDDVTKDRSVIADFDFNPVAAGFSIHRARRPETPPPPRGLKPHQRAPAIRLRAYYLLADGQLAGHALRIDGLSGDMGFLQAVRKFTGDATERPITPGTLPDTVGWARLFLVPKQNVYVLAMSLRAGGYLYRVGPLGSTDPVIGPVSGPVSA